jgi:hypothetical protein
VTDTDPHAPARRPGVSTAIGVLAVLGFVGSVVMVVAHVNLGLPLVAALFVVGAVLFGVVAYGVFRQTTWAWPVALVVNGLGFVSSVMPWRGLTNSGPPALVTLIALALLLSPAGREALLYRRTRANQQA